VPYSLYVRRMNYCDVVCGIRYAQKIGQKAEGVQWKQILFKKDMKKDLFVNKISKKGERRETKHHPSSIITINP